MKILIQLSLDHHEVLLKHAAEESPAYSIPNKRVKMPVVNDSARAEVIVILCDEDQAEMLRESAKHFCPDDVPQIEKWIRIARFDVP